MLHQNEVVMLTLGCCVGVFALMQWRRLSRIPGWNLLFTSYVLLLGAWVSTVLEGFLLPDLLNAAEHGLQALAFVLLALWSWHRFVRAPGRASGP